MEPGGIISGIFVGLIIGALARIVVRNNEPVGCLLTMLIGIVGAGIGLAIGGALGWGFWATFAVQVVVAAVIVMVFTALARPRS
jgi:uncharacterized membrane protein YeaQ/YmgE (transglycosylase-associated protein family)